MTEVAETESTDKIPFEEPRLRDAIQEAIGKAVAFRRNALVAGEPFEDPFDKLLMLMCDGITEIVRVKRHRCVYDDNDLCSVCGEDGRA